MLLPSATLLLLLVVLLELPELPLELPLLPLWLPPPLVRPLTLDDIGLIGVVEVGKVEVVATLENLLDVSVVEDPEIKKNSRFNKLKKYENINIVTFTKFKIHFINGFLTITYIKAEKNCILSFLYENLK